MKISESIGKKGHKRLSIGITDIFSKYKVKIMQITDPKKGSNGIRIRAKSQNQISTMDVNSNIEFPLP